MNQGRDKAMEYFMQTDFITNQIDETIGKNLRKIRASHDVSLAQVARWLNSDEEFVVSLERGHARLRASEMFVLAERFGVRISSFFCTAGQSTHNQAA
jgi:transcriptional regulator with XRE-family HTH domain